MVDIMNNGNVCKVFFNSGRVCKAFLNNGNAL
jgi:hypothetical protein